MITEEDRDDGGDGNGDTAGDGDDGVVAVLSSELSRLQDPALQEVFTLVNNVCHPTLDVIATTIMVMIGAEVVINNVETHVGGERVGELGN